MPKKDKAEAKRPLVRRPPKHSVGKVRDLEKRLAEALEQQAAAADILHVIARSSTDAQPVFDTIVRAAMRLCQAVQSNIQLFDGERMHWVAQQDYGQEAMDVIRRVYPMQPDRSQTASRAILTGRVVNLADVLADPEYHQEMARKGGWRSIMSVPMLRDRRPVGVITVARVEPGAFSGTQVALLQTFADQAVIAIENVRLFTELQEKNQALTEAHAQVTGSLEQQTATADILRVISQAQADAQPVFEAIADSAMRLFGAWSVIVSGLDGDLIRVLAARGGLPGSSEALMARYGTPQPAVPDFPRGRAVLTRTVQHVVDVETDRTWGQEFRRDASERGFRSVVAVPMLRGGEALGVIAVARAAAGGFAPTEIALLQTFADQAVIAIENADLLGELQARTSELMRSVEELKALGEVGQAVSSTLDLPTVLATIVSRAVQLSGAAGGAIYEYDEGGEEFHLRATESLPDEYLEIARQAPGRKGEGATGRLATTRVPVEIADISVPDAYESRTRDALIRTGHRALLAVPLLREHRTIGSLVVFRKTAGTFGAEVVALLQTFATQSALAIQNARLFKEIEAKGREVQVASQHKSEFLANMSHELRTPLNAIVGYSELLEEEAGDLDGGRLVPDLQKIATAAKHQLSLINDILDLSKIEAGRMELQTSDCDLPTAIDSALTLVRERATRREIALGRAIDERVGAIRADERKVKQVLLNLLSNALKFTPEGGRVDVEATVSDGMVEVSVADTGVGIAPEDQEKVFEEFQQVGTAAKKVEGTGLGLALCRKFVELHGGRIRVQSQTGHGSTFTFTLPLRREG
jgi:signal transduction histidine kinase/putative methionine-R-sulfoxide reductase with GAF domain